MDSFVGYFDDIAMSWPIPKFQSSHSDDGRSTFSRVVMIIKIKLKSSAPLKLLKRKEFSLHVAAVYLRRGC